MSCQIIAVCGSIDAMMGKRAYHAPLEADACKSEIWADSGMMYDSEIANFVLEHWGGNCGFLRFCGGTGKGSLECLNQTIYDG